MKKVFTSLVLALTLAGMAHAQNAHEAAVKFNKNNENAVVADYDMPADVVEAALKDKLEKDGLGKMKSSKGFMGYSGVLWNAISADKIDAYLKVDGKKDKSTVTVLVSKGYDNFITSAADAQVVDNVKQFLNDLGKYASGYQIGLNIKAQEEAIKKAEKIYSSSVDNNKDLLAQKEKLERKIAESNNDQVLKQKALDTERQKLNDLKAQAAN